MTEKLTLSLSLLLYLIEFNFFLITNACIISQTYLTHALTQHQALLVISKGFKIES